MLGSRLEQEFEDENDGIVSVCGFLMLGISGQQGPFISEVVHCFFVYNEIG